MAKLVEERGTELMRILEAWQKGLRDPKAIGKSVCIRDTSKISIYLQFLEQAYGDPIVARQLIVAHAKGVPEMRQAA